MTEISEQLEAVIRDIETRTPHSAGCERYYSGYMAGDIDGTEEIAQRNLEMEACNCGRPARIRGEIARTVERMLEIAVQFSTSAEFRAEGIAAALEVIQDEQRGGVSETQERGQ